MAQKIAINSLTNANIYADGNSLLGRAKEIKIPAVKFKKSEHQALGMLGSQQFPSGIDTMEGTISWNCFYADVLEKFSNVYEPIRLQVRGSLESYEGGGRVSQKPVVIFMTVQSDGFPEITFQQHENVEVESSYICSYLRTEVDGEVINEVDIAASIYKVGGKDMMAQYRENLGV